MAVTLNKANLVLKDANGNIGKIEQLSNRDLAKIKTAVSDVALVVNQSNHKPIAATTTNKGVVQLATSADVVAGASDKVVTAEQLHNATTTTKATLDGAGNVITDTYLKKSGDIMTGGLGFSSDGYIHETTNDKTLMLTGGNGWNNGAGLSLCGKDQTDRPGGFLLGTRLSDSNNGPQLIGTREGLLQWNGNNLARAVNGIKPDANGNIAITSVANATNSTNATNATNATKATQDGAGNVITDTYVKKTGDIMPGALGFSRDGYIFCSVNDSGINIAGGNGWDNGAGLSLCGKDQTDRPGGFLLGTRLSDSNNGPQLIGTREGLLQWGTKNLVRSVNGVQAGDNGNVQLGLGVYLVQSWRSNRSWYRVWSDGWCEQGAINGVKRGFTTITLLKAFRDNQYNVLLTRLDDVTDDHVMSGCLQGTYNTSNFIVNCEVYDHNSSITWCAYGYVNL